MDACDVNDFRPQDYAAKARFGTIVKYLQSVRTTWEVRSLSAMYTQLSSSWL